MELTTAASMARSVGINPKTFRAALRREQFNWHSHDTDWKVEVGCPQHLQMIAVLRKVFANVTARE